MFYVKTIILIFIVSLFCSVQTSNVPNENVIQENQVRKNETPKPKVYGPGWDSPQLVFPSRYFFVQNVNVVNVKITPLSSETRCPFWTQIFRDSNFNNITIVRYKLMTDVCPQGIIIQLLGDDVVLAERQYDGDIYSEECHCPNQDWSSLMNCHQINHQQIDEDLNQFDEVDFDLVLDEMKRRFAPHTKSYAFCHYQIVNNKVHKQCYGEYVGFSQFWEEFLKSLLRKTRIPDVEFIANLGDWPLADRSNRKNNVIKLPIFSWCGSTDTYDIVLPTYELTESTLHMQERVSIDVLSVFGKQPIQYQDKIAKAFWRGRDSNENRLKLAKLGKQHPDLINASITNFFFFRDKIDEYGPGVAHVSLFEFFNYKYQLNIDGTVSAYRFPYLLAGNSLVLKQQSKFYEFFYNQLVPGQHFIPVDLRLDNLIDLLSNLTNSSENETELRIIENARQFVLNNLLPEHIYCYYYNLLIGYAKKLKNNNFAMRTEAIEDKAKCKCKRTKDEL